jgi:hypothetical protein
MARIVKTYTVAELNEIALADLIKRKWINATRSNVAYMHNVAKLCRSVANGKQGAHTHLSKLLQDGLPNRFYNIDLTPLAKAAMRSALSRLRFTRSFDGEWDMYAMCIADAADHLNVALRIESGATPKATENLLWRMDTASRDQMDSRVWDWIAKAAYG